MAEDSLDIEILNVIEGDPSRNDPENVADRLLEKPKVIHIFTDGPDESFNVQEMSNYLVETFGPNYTVQLEGDIIQRALDRKPDSKDQLIKDLVDAKKWVRSGGRFGGISTKVNPKKLFEM